MTDIELKEIKVEEPEEKNMASSTRTYIKEME